MVTNNSERELSKKHAFTEITESSGHLFIHINDEPDEITNILDASLSGVRILLKRPLTEAQQLTLSYLADDLHISIEAEVICSEYDAESGQFRTGIRYNPFQSDLSTLFFLAFRKQIDSFDNYSRHLQS